MIKDQAYWEAWERRGPLSESLTPEQAFALNDAMYEYVKCLGPISPAEPLEGLETKIRIARAINSLPPLEESELNKSLGRV